MSEKTIIIDGVSRDLTIDRDGSTYRSGEASIELVAIDRREAVIRANGRIHVVPFFIDGARVSLAYDGEIYTAEVTDKGVRSRARQREQSTAAPMPGLVLKVLVAAGAEVEKGAALVILEAMKMEHTIVAPHAGTVVAVNCREGELVQPGFELVELAPLAKPG